MISNKKKTMRKNQLNRGRANPSRNLPSHPGSIETSFVISKTFRFQNGSSASSTNINVGQTGANGTVGLLDALMVATTTTNLSTIWTAFKLKRVTVWGPPSSSLVPVTCSLTWVTADVISITGSDRTISDTSIGATNGAFITCKPPKGSYQSMWQQPTGSAEALFFLTLPPNAIVDIEVCLRQSMQGSPSAQNFTITGPATVGTVYAYFVDASKVLSPLGLATIV